MIKITEGNLFDSKADIIAHQVNCQGIMGAGVARQVKKKYPTVFTEYLNLCWANHPSKLLGMVQICETPNKQIANLFGQESYGYGDKQYTILSALYMCFSGLKHYAEIMEYSIAIPYKIGCARGGADWELDVYPMIEIIFRNSNVNVEIWKLPEGVKDNEI